MRLNSEKQYFFANLASGYKTGISSVIQDFRGLSHILTAGVHICEPPHNLRSGVPKSSDFVMVREYDRWSRLQDGRD